MLSGAAIIATSVVYSILSLPKLAAIVCTCGGAIAGTWCTQTGIQLWKNNIDPNTLQPDVKKLVEQAIKQGEKIAQLIEKNK